MKSAALFTLGLLAVIATTGCISKQSYGSNIRGHVVNDNSSLAEMFQNMGEPDSIFHAGSDDVYIYKNYDGLSLLGIYSNAKRTDVVFVVDRNSSTIRGRGEVDMGNGTSVISAPITYPILVTELTESVENYSVESGD